MPYCQSCDAEIIWGVTEGGAAIPLDPVPVADGRIVLTPPDDNGRRMAIALTDDDIRILEAQDSKRLRYRTHFASCPYADSHRRTR